MFNRALICVLFFVFSAVSNLSAAEEKGKWETDLEVAKKKAVEEKKNIFALFTGSDWCTYCMMLEKEVLSKDGFLKNLEKDYVLLMVDFPQRKPLSETQQMKNDKLSEDYSIEGFPTVLLLDNEGKAFAKTGYEEGGVENYNKNLKELANKKAERDKKFTEARTKEGVAKAEALIAALKSLGDLPTLQYKNIEQEILAADPEDKSGYKKMTEMKDKLKTLEENIMGLLQEGDSTKAVEKINSFITENKPEGEDLQQVKIFKIFTYDPEKADLDLVLKELDEIIAVKPESHIADMAKELKAQVQSMKNQKVKTPAAE